MAPTAPRRSRPGLVGSIALHGERGAAITEQRVRLLEAIEALGSLSRAAATLPLSYKAAWDALDAMNRHADAPLVERRTGGRGGGGTVLTAEGRKLVALYRALEQTQQTVLDRLPGEAPLTGDTAALRGLVRRLAVRSSARNQWPCRLLALRDEGGRVDVVLQAASGETLVVNITPESVASMALAPGVEVHALVKAPWLDITLRAPRATAGMNALAGVVQSVRPGGSARRSSWSPTAGCGWSRRWRGRPPACKRGPVPSPDLPPTARSCCASTAELNAPSAGEARLFRPSTRPFSPVPRRHAPGSRPASRKTAG